MASESDAERQQPPPSPRPINIGVPPPDHDHDDCPESQTHYGDVRQLVGSPEDISSMPGPSIYSTPLVIPDTPQTRTDRDYPSTPSSGYFASHVSDLGPRAPRSIMNRTVSYPTAPHSTITGRRRPSSVVNEATHNLLRFPRRRPPDHEWTVFGELMGTPSDGGLLDGGGDGPNRASRASIREMFHNLPRSQSRTRGYRASPSRSPRVRTQRESEPPSPYDVFDSHINTPARGRSISPIRSFDPAPVHGVGNGRIPPQRTVSFSQTISSVASERTVMPPPKPLQKESRWTCKIPELPLLYRNILKCSVAYFIGSLFTFNPYLSGFVADLVASGPGDRTPSPSGHMVATM